TLQAGENGGWLGNGYDPVIVRPDRGRPWKGVSRDLGTMVLSRAQGVETARLEARQTLVQRLEQSMSRDGGRSYSHFQQIAFHILLSSGARVAFNLDRETQSLRQA